MNTRYFRAYSFCTWFWTSGRLDLHSNYCQYLHQYLQMFALCHTIVCIYFDCLSHHHFLTLADLCRTARLDILPPRILLLFPLRIQSEGFHTKDTVPTAFLQRSNVRNILEKQPSYVLKIQNRETK